MDKSNNPIPSPPPLNHPSHSLSPLFLSSTLYLHCFSLPLFISIVSLFHSIFSIVSHFLPPSLSPHLFCTGLKKACQLALRAHEGPIHVCAPNVDLRPGVVVKEVTRFQLSAVPLMEQPAQVVVLLHAQLTRPESTCTCHDVCVTPFTPLTPLTHHITC